MACHHERDCPSKMIDSKGSDGGRVGPCACAPPPSVATANWRPLKTKHDMHTSTFTLTNAYLTQP